MKDRLVALKDLGPAPSGINVPKKGDIVTYAGKCIQPEFSDCIYLLEYPLIIPKGLGYASEGLRIAFRSKYFRPVDLEFGEWVESTYLPLAIIEEQEQKERVNKN